AGLYGSGVVVGVFAAPCIGPPIIALLAFVGAQADPLFGFLAFFVLSLGLGLPYLILGTFSSLMHRLPKSGVWMVWVKQVFGVILVGVAFFYGALATYPALAEWMIPATLILGGIYLGFVERSGHNQTIFRRTKWAVGVAAIAGGLFFVQYLQQPALEWEPYSTDRVAEAQAAGKPVMMDFYADWCIPCLELERVTFTDDTVRALGDEFVRLKVDLTQFNSPEAEAVREQYAVAGVPTIVFLDPDGEEVQNARVVGFLSPTRFAERMQQVPTTARQEEEDALAAE
ncbi:MAG: thioredoxin fold domain-containing protein, partial [Bacteroidetes bacterium]|nr:thioredoxin fold domain-containing protein [Bacteroidota bacterium]